jgi:RHS repeat-associated protein
VTNLQFTYDAMGNILSRSDVAGGAPWTYHGAKKHFVTQAGDASHTYTPDANGNAATRNGQTITWTSYNYPSVINGNGKILNFSYDAFRQRFQQDYSSNGVHEVTQYVGDLLEKVTSGGVIDWRHTIKVGDRTVAIMSRQNPGSNTTRYILPDDQGSISKITDTAGSTVVSESFSPCGTRRDPTTWSGSASCPDLVTIKGITREGFNGQDAIGGVSMGLNHMNGRVQDAITGRFLSADPYIAEPGFTQAWNRYSYVNNNPMSFTDPSGFFPLCFTRFFPGPGGNSDGEGGGGFHLGFGGFEADGGVYLFFCIAELPDQVLLPPPNLDTPRMNWEPDSNPQPDSSEQCYAPFSFGDSFLGAYAERVANLGAGIADSVSGQFDAGPQVSAGVNILGVVRPKFTVGSFNLTGSLTGAFNVTGSVTSPTPGRLTYGEASLGIGPVKVGAARASVTQGTSTRTGSFTTANEGFSGMAKATTFESRLGKVGARAQVFFGAKAEIDFGKILRSVNCALSR